MSGIFRPTARLLMQPSKRMFSVSGNGAGTSPIKQKLSQLPIEVYPLGAVVLFGSSFGIYHMAKALYGGSNRGEFRTHRRRPHELNVWEK